MSTAVLAQFIESIANVADYAFPSHAPAGSGRVMVVLCRVDATAVALTCTDTGQGLSWTRVQEQTQGGNKMAAFWAVTTSATAFTANINSGADPGTGAEAVMYEVSGADTAAPHKQSGFATVTGGGTPAVTMGTAFLTANTGLCFLANLANPAGVTEPSGWTEDHDDGHLTPTAGGESAHRDSGETGTTITWGSTSASNGGMLVFEVANAVAALGPIVSRRDQRMSTGA
jgi:hypothetical protein